MLLEDRILSPRRPAVTGVVDVAIIGAGPYGLSIAAHLRARGVEFRIFGTPMETWRTRMPKGMFLKSEGFASNLSDADDAFSLEVFCRERGLPYADIGLPVPLETFAAYGIAFQERFVPNLEQRTVVGLSREGGEFLLQLDDGEEVRARRVVVAVGIRHYDYLPPELMGIPREYLSHSCEHHEVERFRGSRVTVIGAGASAVDLAIALNEAGAETTLVARTPALRFHEPPPAANRSLFKRLRFPRSGLGLGWKGRFFCDQPDAFSVLPEDVRIRLVRTQLGPAPCWFTKGPFESGVRSQLGSQIVGIAPEGERVNLTLRGLEGSMQRLEADHVIAATGYRVDLQRLRFIGDPLRSSIRTAGGAPVLSRGFGSSVNGLYFVGISAANTFGPLLRFAYGARFAARRLSAHLAA